MSEFRLPAAPKVRTIKVTGIVRRRCDLGPIWGRNTAEVEKVHGQNVRNFSAQILEVDQVMLWERKSRKCAPEGTPPPGEGEEIKAGMAQGHPS